jgi:tetratricopeptide (TPR) repeat protein
VFWTGRGDLQRAEAGYRRAIALWPPDPTPRQNLAMLLAEQDRDGEATTELDAILARHRDWAPAHFALGLLAERAGDWEQAAAHYERCLEHAPEYPTAALHLGRAYAAVGRTDRAEKAFEIASRDADSRGEALRELVRLAYERGDEATVQRWLPEALLADPGVASDPRVREALGQP